MYKRNIISAVLCLVAIAQPSAGGTNYQKLRELYFEKQYFELVDALHNYRQDPSPELFFYTGAITNKFNRPWLSIRDLKKYSKHRQNDKGSPLLIECYEILADNYVKTYQYRKAAKAYEELLSRFGDDIDAAKKKSYPNVLKLWSLLVDVPPQTVSFKGDSIIKKDREGHFPLRIGNEQLALAFDTGANPSVLTDSLAKKLGLRLIEASIKVSAVAG